MRKADNLPQFFAFVTKSGTLNFLEPSGPVQACKGTALPLPFIGIFVSDDNLTLLFFQSRIGELWNFSEGFFWQTVTPNEHLKGKGICRELLLFLPRSPIVFPIPEFSN